VGSAFPLGLVERSFEMGDPQDLIVYPRIGRLTEAWRSRFQRGAAPIEQAIARVGVFEEEFQRLREYRGGDAPRSIHWRTTARRNELMVREFEHHRDHDTLVVLDLWASEKPTSDEYARVELAVSFVASLCADQAAGGGIPCLQLLMCGKNFERVTPPGQHLPLQVLLERLALAEAGGSRDLDETLSAIELTDSAVRRILVTTRPLGQGDSAPRAQPRSAPPLPDRAANFELVEASPESLAAYLVFDVSSPEGRG
jgi:uncharacterized protein (DUF58 family)